MARYIRLDNLSAVELTSWEVLWGPKCDAVKVRKSHLRKWNGEGTPPSRLRISDFPVNDVPHLSISANWAVRLVDANSLDARAARIAYLVARDGERCFYCERDLAFTRDPAKGLNYACEVEHIIPTAHGGPDHASNLCLTCAPCNRAMGALSGVEKVKLAIKMRVGSVNVANTKEKTHAL